MPRVLFEKTGNAVWISHLDLMRLFQRAFKRAGLPLTHTKGFNPRPSVSIALPLSVGVESACELLDFELDGEQFSCEEESGQKPAGEGFRIDIFQSDTAACYHGTVPVAGSGYRKSFCRRFMRFDLAHSYIPFKS